VEGPREGVQEVKGMAQGPGFCPEGEEVKKTDNITKTKRRKIAHRELRIMQYDRAIELRRQGLSLNKIRVRLQKEFGDAPHTSTLSYWTRGLHNPYNSRGIPSPKLFKPSKELAYLIMAILGDGYAYIRILKDSRQAYIVRLDACDKEFVEKAARCAGLVLNRPPPKVNIIQGTRKYYFEVASKALYELLKKPLEELKQYIEHCEECTTSALQAFFDAEGSVYKDGRIVAANTNYELLVYIQQQLLMKCGIETTGTPRINTPQGKLITDHRNGKTYQAKKDCYRIFIRKSSNETFYRRVGFTIRRKQERLEAYLRRRGLLQED
jgi:intein-encoded DNA endonuclease-like protein